jgi:hypothetical protein
MRRGAAGLAASLGLALAVCCPASAGAAKHPAPERPIEIPTRVAGAITIAWHGDPARGCAAAGVCDVSGSVVYTPGEADVEATMLPGGRLVPDDVALLSLDTSGTVRVRRDPPGGAPSMCVDTVDAPFIFLTPTPLSGGRFRFDVSDAALASTDLSSGRCAGPVPSDLRDKLPSGVLDTKALSRGPTLLNLSARQPFASGPFSGEMVSTVGLRVGAGSHSAFSGFFTSSEGDLVPHRAHHRRHVRVLEVGLEYRVAGLSGQLTTSFTGAAEPLCAGLDACGTSGTIAYSPAATSGRVVVGAERRLRAGERPTRRSALAELRAGRLVVFGDVELRQDTLAHVSSTVTRPGDTTCTDSVTTPFAPFSAFEAAHALQLRLGKPSEELGPDGLRTRCPGPGESDTLARGSLAAGRIGLGRLGVRSLSVTLTRPGTFASGAYTGTRSGALTLRLVRRRIDERVVRRSLGR